MEMRIIPVTERPDLVARLYDFPDAWPEFLYHDLVLERFYEPAVARHPELCLVAYDPAEPDRLLAKATALPVSWDGTDAALPPTGYDAMLAGSAADALAGRKGGCVAASEIVVQRHARGAGLSERMLRAMRENAAALGYRDLLAPVRPNLKHRHPDMPMPEYLRRTRDDGQPEDAWLRIHLRAGGRLVGLAPVSMTVVGTLAQWRSWTGLPFDADGPVHVPEALVPVQVDLANDRAIYIEPNVWVHHRL